MVWLFLPKPPCEKWVKQTERDSGARQDGRAAYQGDVVAEPGEGLLVVADQVLVVAAVAALVAVGPASVYTTSSFITAEEMFSSAQVTATAAFLTFRRPNRRASRAEPGSGWLWDRHQPGDDRPRLRGSPGDELVQGGQLQSQAVPLATNLKDDGRRSRSRCTRRVPCSV